VEPNTGEEGSHTEGRFVLREGDFAENSNKIMEGTRWAGDNEGLWKEMQSLEFSGRCLLVAVKQRFKANNRGH
jgi:hypothetical protein